MTIPYYTRFAELRDAISIRDLVCSRTVSLDQKNNTGLIDYHVPQLEDFEESIRNHNIQVVVNESSLLVGFIDIRSKTGWSTDYQPEELLNVLLRENVDFYIHLIVISSEYEGLGLGYSLLLESIEELTGKVCAIISESPMENKRSFSVFEKVGFKKKHSITLDGMVYNVVIK